jgi:hypothetical protein
LSNASVNDEVEKRGVRHLLVLRGEDLCIVLELEHDALVYSRREYEVVRVGEV